VKKHIFEYWRSYQSPRKAAYYRYIQGHGRIYTPYRCTPGELAHIIMRLRNIHGQPRHTIARGPGTGKPIHRLTWEIEGNFVVRPKRFV